MSYLTAHEDARGTVLNAIPSMDDRKQIYVLFMKIGATGELPTDKPLRDMMLNNFWVTLYLRNNLVPGDIPYSIIMEEFTLAMVQGVIGRKGNNQAAICKAFNDWITTQDVRNRLYEIRDKAYPDRKPNQITETATEPTIKDYTLEELKERRKNIEKMAGLKTADSMLKELDNEIERRK